MNAQGRRAAREYIISFRNASGLCEYLCHFHSVATAKRHMVFLEGCTLMDDLALYLVNGGGGRNRIPHK